jgi:16S rRNA (guanine527-N7)-methyltransferase
MIAKRVAEGAAAMGIALDGAAAERFARYYELLVEGNARMNLTTVLEPEEAVDRHFLDSLAPIAQGLIPEGATVVDVGTGAGFPGLPLLIARPDLRLTLVDALNKRLDFLRGVLEALGLGAEIVHMRAEDFSRKAEYREQFDLAVARAVAPVSPLMEYLLPCVRRGGAAICWKGPEGAQEAQDARKAIFLLGGKVRAAAEYAVPGRDWRHTLLIVDKVSATPKTYPRRAGTPSKSPL